MEASNAGPEQENVAGVAGSEVEPSPASPEGAQQDGEAHAEATASDEQPSEGERNPAADQAPAATERQDAIVGDPGLRGEQQPVQEAGTAANVDNPTRTSAPPPAAQSGVPLAEDRAAGVEPGPSGPIAPAAAESEEETPEHDASEGQSATPPLGS